MQGHVGIRLGGRTVIYNIDVDMNICISISVLVLLLRFVITSILVMNAALLFVLVCVMLLASTFA